MFRRREEPVPTAAAAVLKVIDDQLAQAHATAESLQTRSTAVVSACGALIAIFLGLAGIVTSLEGYQIPGVAAWFLAAAVILFALAGTAALVVARPVKAGMFDIKSLQAISVPDVLALPATKAHPRIAEAQIQVIEIARELNRMNGRFLFAATILGIPGIACAAAGAALSLLIDAG
ncbi:hypothetical protein [Microbacterium sp. bgisy189]|uniref:hypothetical protein n=1 Tax=Microbacterium sp. bgisy189 TaxID=3413798 RepID=UPI003EB8C992